MPRRPDDFRSDLELIEACNEAAADDATRAFETLYKRHRDFVLRVAMRFTRNSELAADVLQETFTYFLKRFPPTGPRFVLTSTLTTYLYAIAKNFAISAIRKRDRFAPSGAEPDELAGPDDPTAGAGEIDRALASLSPERREVLVLRFVDDLSLQEIAEALEIPLGTVKSRLHLGIRALRSDPKIKHLFEP